MTSPYQKVRTQQSLHHPEPSIPPLNHLTTMDSPPFLPTTKLTAFPAATVQKIINEVLASKAADENAQSMSFAKETRDLLIECCVEFITMISTEANEIAEKDAKKTIACEHITKALEELGFGEYVQEIMAVADSFKNNQVVSYTGSSYSVVFCFRWSAGLHDGTKLTMRPHSHERRRETRWSRAACRPRSSPVCRKSSSARQVISSTLLRPRKAARSRLRPHTCKAPGRGLRRTSAALCPGPSPDPNWGTGRRTSRLRSRQRSKRSVDRVG